MGQDCEYICRVIFYGLYTFGRLIFLRFFTDSLGNGRARLVERMRLRGNSGQLNCPKVKRHSVSSVTRIKNSEQCSEYA